MTQPLEALHPGEILPPRRPAPAPETETETRPGRLWIAIHLPEFPDGHRELVALACRARRITPLVCLEPPQALVLEIGGSLRLWGGLGAIREALGHELRRRRLTASLCAAPTALAALWLARGGQEDVLSVNRLAGRLGALPLRVTEWPRATRRLLEKMGVRTLGDCLRLPREGLMRRVGRRCLDDLDRSLGRQMDSRTAFRPDRRFRSVVEFQEEVTEPQVIAAAGRRLILRLAEALHRQQAQIASCRYGFHHLHRPATVVRIDQVVPTYESHRIATLFLNRLETLSLPAPVTALSLTTGRIAPMTGINATLFPACRESAPPAALGDLVARLRTRFGAAAVHGLGLVMDHRPEAAWSRIENLRTGPVAGKELAGYPQRPPRFASSPANARQRSELAGYPRRPLWLLSAPVGIPTAAGGRARLRLVSCAERIEAGWWEGFDTGRDYHVARGRRGERLWVFRDCRSDRDDWHLIGLFG